MSNWYNQKGKIQIGATLREARKENLVPRVTAVLSEIKNKVLDDWKVKQAVLKAINTKNEFENIDEHVSYVMKTYMDNVNKTADFGTTVHNLIERHIKDQNVDLASYDENIQNAVKNATDWISREIKVVVASERTWVSNQYGYAGTIDLIAELRDGRLALIDFKTQDSKNCKLYSYPSFVNQLAAYKIMYEESANTDVDVCMNIVLARNVDYYKVFEYTVDEIYLGKIVFLAALDIFRYSRNFIWEEQE